MKEAIERLKVVDDGSIQTRPPTYEGGKAGCMECYARVGEYHRSDCGHQLKAAWAVWAPLVDLREISREPDVCKVSVHLLPERYGRFYHPWIFAGQASLDRRNERTHEHTLRVYLGRGATDFEHDSAYALQLPLYGVVFERVDYHSTVVQAFIPPDLQLDDFKVPAPGYNPFELSETVTCDDERCGEAHPIVPEDCYVPKGDRGVLQAVRGMRVEVRFGPVRVASD